MFRVRRVPIGIALLSGVIIVGSCDGPSFLTAPESSPPSFAVGDSLPAAAESFIRQDFPNGHWGDPPFVRVSAAGFSAGLERGLVRFDQDSIDNVVGSGTLDSAILELTISAMDIDLPEVVSAHRVTQPWVELQATWNCANDPEDDGFLDCAPADLWDMDSATAWPFSATATDSVLIPVTPVDSLIRYDVTADVAAFLAQQQTNSGWLLKYSVESNYKTISFWSKEAPGQGFAQAVPPRLALFVSVGDTTMPQVPNQVGGPATPLYIAIPNRRGTYVRNSVEIAFDDTTSGTTVNGFLSKYGASIVGGAPSRGAFILEIPDPGPTFAAYIAVIDSMGLEVGVRRAVVRNGLREIGTSGRYPWSKEAPGKGFAQAVPPTLGLFVTPMDTIIPPLPSNFVLPAGSLLITSHPSASRLTYLRNMLGIVFDDSTSGTTINLLFQKYGATVLGGIEGVGAYLVEIPDAGTFISLDSIRAAFNAEVGVDLVFLQDWAGPVRVSGLFPSEGGANTRSAWSDSTANHFVRSHRAVRAPLAWGWPE